MKEIKNIKNMDVDWGYTGEHGPEHWATLCDWFSEGAKFPYQSPIKLSKEKTVELADEQKLIFHYKREEFTEKEFKNTFHFVPPNTESYVIYKNELFFLTDIHYHMPSEHLIENQQYPLEFHLVHMNKAGENLVVACLFQITAEKNAFSKQSQKIIWEKNTHQQWFNPSIFLPETCSYFSYVGSLTTPPTKGPVHWFVFDTIQKMDKEFIEIINQGMLPFNNRPLQPLNGRKVYFSN